MNQPRDELLERYADAVAQDPRRPSDRVRHAARAHAQMLRDQAAVTLRAGSAGRTQPAANQPTWTLSWAASLAVVGLAGLLYLQIDRSAPETREAALGSNMRNEAPARTPSRAVSGNTPTAQVAAAPHDAAIAAHKVSTPGPSLSAPIHEPPQTTASTKAAKAHSPQVAQADALDAPPRERGSSAASAATRFLEAAQTGRTDSLQELLTQGVSVNARDDQGNTALILAVRHNKLTTARKLMDLGANASLVNHEGQTALDYAHQLGLAAMVQLLQTPR